MARSNREVSCPVSVTAPARTDAMHSHFDEPGVEQ